MKRVVPRDQAHRDVENAIDHYAHEAGPDIALGFGGMVVLITADAVLGKSTEDMLCDLMDQAEFGDIAAAPGHGVHALLRLDEKAVRAAVAEILVADASFVPLVSDDVTDADIREACTTVAARIDLTEIKDQAEFNAALTALRAAKVRRAD